MFGLNALGGAVNLVMKNGFTWQGTALSAQGGTYGHGHGHCAIWRRPMAISAFMARRKALTDSGWRLHSPSDMARLYADTGWRIGDSELHLAASGSVSGLGVVGPTPIELLQQASTAVYTYPQTTHNLIGSLALNDKTRLSDNWQLEASVYVRALRQRHVDGNDGNFESCSSRSSFGGDLCLQDDAFGTPPGGKTTGLPQPVRDHERGGPGVSVRQCHHLWHAWTAPSPTASTQGGTLQVTGNQPLFGLTNYFTAGGSIDHSAIGFQSSSTLGPRIPQFRCRGGSPPCPAPAISSTPWAIWAMRRSIWAPPPTTTGFMPWTRWT